RRRHTRLVSDWSSDVCSSDLDTIPNGQIQSAAMAVAAPPVRRVTLDDVRAARERIRNIAVRTPLVRLRHDAGTPEIWLKLETLQIGRASCRERVEVSGGAGRV